MFSGQHRGRREAPPPQLVVSVCGGGGWVSGRVGGVLHDPSAPGHPLVTPGCH